MSERREVRFLRLCNHLRSASDLTVIIPFCPSLEGNAIRNTMVNIKVNFYKRPALGICFICQWPFVVTDDLITCHSHGVVKDNIAEVVHWLGLKKKSLFCNNFRLLGNMKGTENILCKTSKQSKRGQVAKVSSCNKHEPCLINKSINSTSKNSAETNTTLNSSYAVSKMPDMLNFGALTP